MAKLKDGFYKQTAEAVGSNSYMLLAGGGSKALSDFATASGVVTALGTNGNYVTWTKNGTANNLTVPYATLSDSANKLTTRFSFGGGENKDKYFYVGSITLKQAWQGYHSIWSFTGCESAWSGLLYIGFRATSNTKGFAGVTLEWLSLTDSQFNNSVHLTYTDTTETTNGVTKDVRICRIYFKLPSNYKSTSVSVIFESGTLEYSKSIVSTYEGTLQGTSTGNKDTNIYVNQHTGNNIEYPLVWSNQANSNSDIGNQLYKSYNHLSYNPGLQRLTTGHLKTGSLFVNTSDATLKIYSGRTKDGVDDGYICMQTCIDGVDGQTHEYASEHAYREAILLQPRGGRVYIGTNPDGGDATYKLYVNGRTFSTGLNIDSGSDGKIVLNNTDAETKYQFISFRQEGTEYGTLGTLGDNVLKWSGNTILHSGNYTSYVNTTNFPGLNSVGDITGVTAGAGLSGGGTSGSVTLTNAGVRSTTINGDYLRVNTNGTNADLTIPYATTAGTINGFTKRATANCTWGTLTASNEYTPVYWGDTASGGGIGYSDKGGKTYMQIDGDYYAQEGTKLVLHTGNSAVSGGGSSWGSSITVNIGGTSKTLTIPSNPNTDTKVTQTVTSSNATYPLLLAPSGQTATTTTTAYFDSGVTLNPSTNTIAANISGTAANATTLNSVSESEFFRYRGTLVSNTDLNTMFTSGIYANETGNGTNNSNLNEGYGYVLSFKAASSYYKGMHLTINSSGTVMKVRTYWANKWNSWKQLAFTSDIPTVTNYYWANVKISSSSNEATTPTFSTITTTGVSYVATLRPSTTNQHYLGSSNNRWNGVFSKAGNFSGQITLSVATGTSPFKITSTTVNTNLNADMLDGKHASDFAEASHSHSYLPLAGGTMTGNIVAHVGDTQRGIKFGSGYLNSLSNQLLWQSDEAIRFGSATWNWDAWAGLKYKHSNKIIYLGLADGTIFNANTAQSGGKLYLPGISEVYTGNGTNKILHAGNSSVSGGGSSGGSSITVDIGGTSKTLTVPTSLPANGGNASTVSGYSIVVQSSRPTTVSNKQIIFVYE